MALEWFFYKNMDVSEGIIVSIIALVVLSFFFLYKKNNNVILGIVNWMFKPTLIKIQKDNRTRDWLILILLIFVVVTFNFKLISLMVIVSDSMVPEFQRGDIILTQSIDLHPEVGDIITFNVKNQKTATSHRVVSMDGNYIKTQGDNIGLPDRYETTQKDVIAKAIQINGHPIVVKNLGSLFITDYSQQGIISKFGDRFTFLQQLSLTIKAWGLIITIIAIIAYIFLMVGETSYARK